MDLQESLYRLNLVLLPMETCKHAFSHWNLLRLILVVIFLFHKKSGIGSNVFAPAESAS